jgi:anti-sigma B factor antagonist
MYNELKLFYGYDRVDRVANRIHEESFREEGALKQTKIELLGEEEDLVHIKLTGRLDTTGTAGIDTTFTAMISPRGKHALVDISDVSFLASMGIRMMVSVARTLARKQKRLVLYGPPSMVTESIEDSGLKEMLALVSSEKEARAQL